MALSDKERIAKLVTTNQMASQLLAVMVGNEKRPDEITPDYAKRLVDNSFLLAEAFADKLEHLHNEVQKSMSGLAVPR